MSKKIECHPLAAAKSTKEVLGEHLYQKIYEELKPYEIDPQLQVEGRLTGMFLELPADEVVSMLSRKTALRLNLRRALKAVASQIPAIENTVTQFEQQLRVSLTPQDIGEVIYDKVKRLEPELAGKITGMLLELDTTILLSFLECGNTKLPAYVDKAKETLREHAYSQPCQTDLAEKTNKLEAGAEYGTDQETACVEEKRQEIGVEIYNEVLKVYPQCADKITGMILELDLSSLEDLVQNKDLMAESIERAYQTWREWQENR